MLVARCSAVCLLFTSQHVNRLSRVVSCCSQIPVRNLLFSARRSLRPCQFLFLAFLCVPLGSCYSYLAARRLLLSVFNFFKGPKLFTLMNLNVTRLFRSIGVGLYLWEHNLGLIFQKEFLISAPMLKQLTADRCLLLDLATGRLRLIISSRSSFIAVLYSLIVFRVR